MAYHIFYVFHYDKPLRYTKLEKKSEERNMEKERRKDIFIQGLKDGFPIGLGYFAVAFSLGMIIIKAGLNAFQGFVTSITVIASAGEYAGFLSIAAMASYLELAIIMFVTNARYLLMSTAMSQRLEPGLSMKHRILMGFTITDEIFAVTIAQPGYMNPWYTYGVSLTSVPLWAIGTSVGIITGNILPLNVVSALSVALYGMFIAVIIPPARKSKVIAGVVIVCFILSFVWGYIPALDNITAGTKTIILTVVISAIAAVLFPVKEEEEETANA